MRGKKHYSLLAKSEILSKKFYIIGPGFNVEQRVEWSQNGFLFVLKRIGRARLYEKQKLSYRGQLWRGRLNIS